MGMDKMFSHFVLFLVVILKLSSGEALIELIEANNGSVRSGCPEWNELPRVYNKKFIAARIYGGQGHDIPALSCNGHYDEESNEKQDSTPPGYGWPVCTLYTFCESYYTGTVKTFEGPVFFSKLPTNYFCGHYLPSDIPAIASLIADCRQHYPDCSPSDDWVTVASLDNTDSTIPAKFTYEYSIGTSWSVEMSEGMSADATISEEMSVAFFEIFEAKIGVSVTTGYNWNKVSSQAQNEVKKYTDSVEVPAGKIIQMQQAKGTCGGSNVFTEMFRNLVP